MLDRIREMKLKRESSDEELYVSHPIGQPGIAWNWEETPYNPGWHEPTFEVLQRHIPSESRILEIGAGGSYALPALVKRNGCTGFGVEPDTDGLRRLRRFAQTAGVSVDLIQGDGFALPFDDSAFDVVYSQGLVEHFEEAQTADLLSEHRRVCRDDGVVIVSVPNQWNLLHTFRKKILGTRYEYYPERSFTPSKLNEVLRSCGLQVVAVDGVLPLWPFGVFSSWWRVLVVLERLGLLQKINNMKRPAWRAHAGMMTYAIARKVPDEQRRH